jgi:hypothetical protein
MASVNITAYTTDTEFPGQAISLVTTASNGALIGYNISLTPYSPGNSYRVMSLLQSLSPAGANQFVVLGFSDGTKFVVMLILHGGGTPSWYILKYSNYYTQIGQPPSDSVPAGQTQGQFSDMPKDLWAYVENDNGLLMFGVSADGVIPMPLCSYIPAEDGAFISGFPSYVFWGHYVQAAGGAQVTLRCFDVNGLTRTFPTA